MVTFGNGSKSKNRSTSSSTVNFPTDFLDKARNYFGADPGYAPKYVGFGSPADLDKLESNIYGGTKSKLTDAYNTAIGRQREELSQSGLLNSPNQYMEGGARNVLDKGFLQNIQQAARDAALARLGVQQTEAGRETGFNQDTAKTLLQSWFNKLGLATGVAGKTVTGTGGERMGGGSNFGLSGGDVGALTSLLKGSSGGGSNGSPNIVDGEY